MAARIDATFYTPLKSVTAFECIDRGIELTVDDMTMQVHVLKPDVVRVRISPDAFVDKPTHAVSADLGPLNGGTVRLERVEFDVTHDAKSIRLKTAAMMLTIGRSPFRIDAHRADGSVIFETADVTTAKAGGLASLPASKTKDEKLGAYLHLNDEFLVARKIGKKDAILGLGEKTDSFNRRGRRFSLWNTDVLDPDASGQFMKGIDHGDPRRDPTSTQFDPYYMSIPFFYHVDNATGSAAGFFVDNGYCGRYEFDDDDQYRFHFAGGQYTE